MIGLIFKDILNLKKNFKMFGLVIIMYAAIAFISKEASFFNSIFTMLFAILVFNMYSYDEVAKWDSYALTLPLSRENMVQSKYIVMLLMDFTGALISIIFTVVLNTIQRPDTPFAGINSVWIGAVIVLLFYSITIPFITKLGVEKARIIFLVIYLVPFLIFYFLGNALKSGSADIPQIFMKLGEFFLQNVYLIVPIVIILALSISYQVSVYIYNKKEF